MANHETSPATSRAVVPIQSSGGKLLIKVFVATNQTQGRRKSDFCHAIEGEIVRFGVECDGESVDGPCGCRRSLIGLRSGKGTTTFVAAEPQIAGAELVEKVRRSYEETGWLQFMTAEDVQEEAQQLLSMAAPFPVGAVVERRGNCLRQRC